MFELIKKESSVAPVFNNDKNIKPKIIEKPFPVNLFINATEEEKVNKSKKGS